MSNLSAEDYQFVSAFLHRETGISLGQDKEYLVQNRLGEVCKAAGIDNVTDLIAQLRVNPAVFHRQKIIEAMTTNETSFFRDVSPFDSIKNHILPELFQLRKSERRLRIWSAACSSGQEPYTLAMILWMHFGENLSQWKVEIVATDLAEKVLERARLAEYSQLEVNRGLPAQYLMNCFKKKGGKWHVIDPVRGLVSFHQVNLLNPPVSIGHFDLILCRNVLIYFEPKTKTQVLHALTDHLRSDGILMVGASEVMHGLTPRIHRVQRGSSTCYQLAI